MTQELYSRTCEFCQHSMQQDGKWWDCAQCSFCCTHDDSSGPHYKFEYILGDWGCALNVYPKLNKTVLTAFHTNYGLTTDNILNDYGHTHIEIPYAMIDVTPNNISNKIKLILMFS